MPRSEFYYIFDAEGEYFGERKSLLGCVRAIARGLALENYSDLTVKESDDGSAVITYDVMPNLYFEVLPKGHKDLVITGRKRGA